MKQEEILKAAILTNSQTFVDDVFKCSCFMTIVSRGVHISTTRDSILRSAMIHKLTYKVENDVFIIY